jgi:drug/metabolite transporter (DMT)-like permease
VQLLQLFMTLAFAALIGGETLDPEAWLFGLAVMAVVLVQRTARVRPHPVDSPAQDPPPTRVGL